MKTSNLKKWRKVTEFAVVSLATWLNPEAGLLLFLLKLCFKFCGRCKTRTAIATKRTK
jgi:hypothetical protein